MKNNRITTKEEVILVIESIKISSNVIKNIFGLELLLCFYILFIVNDQNAKTIINLPIFQVKMSATQFLLLAPFSLLIVHYYLHSTYAELITKLSFIFNNFYNSDKIPKGLIISPWLFIFDIDKGCPEFNLPNLVKSQLYKGVFKFLINFLVPITASIIWYNFIGQQFLTSLIPAFAIIFSIHISVHSKAYIKSLAINLFLHIVFLVIIIFTLSSVPSLRSILFLDKIWTFILTVQNSNEKNIAAFIIMPLAFFSIFGLIIDILFFQSDNPTKKSYKIKRARRISFLLKLNKLNIREGVSIEGILFNGIYMFSTISGHGFQLGYGISIFIGSCLFITFCFFYSILFLIKA